MLEFFTSLQELYQEEVVDLSNFAKPETLDYISAFYRLRYCEHGKQCDYYNLLFATYILPRYYFARIKLFGAQSHWSGFLRR